MMKLSRKMLVGTTLAMLLTANSVYAKDATHKITSAETGSLATVAAIDKAEIMLAVLANNKKVSSGVADFAKMMIDMHGSNLTQILEMANTLNAKPLTSSTATKLQAQCAKALFSLGGLEGEQFDKAYVDDMVKGHQDALNLIDTQLLKTAKSDEIKKFLTDTRGVVEQHLEAAKKLQANMAS